MIDIFYRVNCSIHALYSLLWFADGHLTNILQDYFTGIEAIIWLAQCQLWWRHQMETFSALLALWAGNSPVTSEFPSQRPVTWSFDVFFHLHMNKQLSKLWRCQWCEMPTLSLWCYCNEWSNHEEYGMNISQKQLYNISKTKQTIAPCTYLMSYTIAILP